MIDPYDKGTIDIFDPEHWHPANRPESKKISWEGRIVLLEVKR